MSTYTISTVEELASIAYLDSDGDGGYAYVIVSGDLHITESIDVPGLILGAGSLSCEKGLTIQGDMYIDNGSVSVTGDFKVRYSVIHGGLSVGGKAEIPEQLYLHSISSIGGNLLCGYLHTDDSWLNVGGDVLIPGDIYAGGADIGGNLSIGGIAVFGGILDVGKNINVGRYLVVSDGGSIVAGNNIHVAEYIACDGPITAG